MRKCIRCNCNMIENYDVKVEGGAYGLKVTKQGIFKDNLGNVFVKRKCEQKGPQKVSTFSTRFHVVSNAFPKYQMLTF